MSELVDVIMGLIQRVSELERRNAGSQWRGKVKEVDPKAATARLIIGQDEDGKDVLSPPLPYAQTAGAMKIHSPPSVGQQMEISAQGGDMEQGTLRPLHWSSENTAPSENGEEHVITLGTTTIRVKGDEVFVKRGEATLHMKANGSIDIDGPTSFKKPVVFEKGFTAKAGDGGTNAGLFEGSLHTTNDITSQTKVQAPTLQGTLIS